MREINTCGTEVLFNSYEHDKYYGDNQTLVDILMENGININKNYLKQIEEAEAMPVMGSEMFKSSSTHYDIPIKAWIYRNNNGTGNITTGQVYQVVNNLNNLFSANTNINFYLLCDIEVINNSNYANNGGQYFDDYINDNRVSGAINIHFVIQSSWKGRATWPWDNPSFACAVETDSFYDLANIGQIANTTAHEIGHTLGLYHTHHPGRRGNNFDLNEQCGDCYQEAVSRSKRQGVLCVSTFNKKKCEVNGDFLCDTPADPGLFYSLRYPQSYVLSGCEFDEISAGKDNWGDTWQPQIENIMGYAPYSCRSVFSPLQVAKMYGYIDDIGINYPTLNISGPNYLCAGNMATFSVPFQSGITFFWEMPYNMNLISGQGTNSVVVQSAGNYGGTIKVTPSCGNRAAKKIMMNIQEPAIEGYDQACPLFTYTYSTPFIANADYEWTVTNGYVVSGQYTNEAQIALTSSPSHQTIIDLELSNVCTQNLYNQKIVTHGDPPPPAQQCFSQQEKNPELFTKKENWLLDEDILVYPNPANTGIAVVVPNEKKYKVVILDMTGRKLFESEKAMQGYFTMNVQSYPVGIYIMQLIGESQKISKKIILKR